MHRPANDLVRSVSFPRIHRFPSYGLGATQSSRYYTVPAVAATVPNVSFYLYRTVTFGAR